MSLDLAKLSDAEVDRVASADLATLARDGYSGDDCLRARLESTLRKVREGERRFPHVPRFDASTLPRPEDDPDWLVRSHEIIDAHVRRVLRDIDGRMAAAWAPPRSTSGPAS